jgi:pre-60S factor REI1
MKKAKVLTVEDCLFCNNHSTDLSSNLEHMTSTHGLFIPDIEYLKDLEGLIRYLADKVSLDNVCLYCNGKGKHFESLDAVQAHMRALSHCKLLYENNEVEYEDYYDFSTDYSELDADKETNVRISEDGGQLIFNDGRSVGHRNLAIFYRQKFKLPESRECVIVNKLMSEYRLLGWHENTASHKKSTDNYTERRNLYFQYKVGLKSNNQKFHNSQNNIIA